jgi:hypothetical protein
MRKSGGPGALITIPPNGVFLRGLKPTIRGTRKKIFLRAGYFRVGGLLSGGLIAIARVLTYNSAGDVKNALCSEGATNIGEVFRNGKRRI